MKPELCRSNSLALALPKQDMDFLGRASAGCRLFKGISWNGTCARVHPALLRLHFGFVNEHDRDIVFDGIDAPTLATLEPLSVRGQLYRFLTKWADQNIEQFLTNCHR